MISGFIHLPRMLKNAANYFTYFGPPRAIILSPSGMNNGRATPHRYGQRRVWLFIGHHEGVIARNVRQPRRLAVPAIIILTAILYKIEQCSTMPRTPKP